MGHDIIIILFTYYFKLKVFLLFVHNYFLYVDHDNNYKEFVFLYANFIASVILHYLLFLVYNYSCKIWCEYEIINI